MAVEPNRNGNRAERSEYFRQLQKLSRETYTGTGGFGALSKARRKEISTKGGHMRWAKAREGNEAKG